MLPRLLTRYQIVQPLGEGGMSRVYLAHDTLLDRPVAVKVLPAQNFTAPGEIHRFRQEAITLARLTHPNIVNILEFGESEGIPYLVMDYLPGGSLKEKIGEPIPWQEAARLLVPIASALEYAHLKNIIHRDVKPSNILFGDTGQPVLSDFGIARVCQTGDSQANSQATTIANGFVGTPQYMSPEQSLGRPVDIHTDIYSLGVVFYELLTGRTPFDGDTPLAILVRQTRRPLVSPRRWLRTLPRAVENILAKALAPEPEDRFATMHEFECALEILAAGSLVALNSPGESETRTRMGIRPMNIPRMIMCRVSFPRRWIAWTIGIFLAAYLAGYALGWILSLLDSTMHPGLLPLLSFPL